MNVLVTGGAGFIGSTLSEALLARGDRVTILDCFDTFYEPRWKRTNVAAVVKHPGCTLFEGDIRSRDTVRAALAQAKPEVIIHLAARAGVRPSIEDPLLYCSVNVEGTAVMLEEARQAKVNRFVFTSSSSVYGARSKAPFQESDRVDHPVSPYAATKAAGELMCSTYAHLFGMEIVALRLFTVFGPRQRPDLAIAKFVRLIQEGAPLPFFGDGTTARDYTFVGDIVAGFIAAADHRWPKFEVLNLGGAHPATLNEMVATIERVVGKKAQLQRLPEQPGDVPLTSAAVQRAHELLGWSPKVSLEEGIRRYVDWAKTSGR